MEQTFESILQELLSDYDRTKGISVDEFLSKKLEELGADKETQAELNIANHLIDKFDENAKSLKQSRQFGQTRGDWMFKELSDSIGHLPAEASEKIVNAIEEAANTRTNDLLNE